MASGNLIRVAQAYVELSVRGSRRAEAELAGFQGQMVRLSCSMVQVGKAMTLAAGLSGAGFVFAIAQASNLQESVNKTKEVFGAQTKSILDWSKTSATAFGLSRQSALEYTSQLGLILQKSGLAGESTSQMSQELIQLTADAASFNNVGLDLSFEKIKSALVGEAKPIRTFGVLMSEAAVTARAAELGLEKLNGEFTEGAKVAARYLLITEGLEKAQGDFERTSGDVANQIRIVKASVINLATAIGTALLPEVSKILDGVIRITEATGRWAEANEGMSRLLAGLTISVGTAGASLLILGSALGILSRAWDRILSALDFLIRALGLLVRFLRPVVALFATLSAATVAWASAIIVVAGFLTYWLAGGFKERKKFNDATALSIELEEKRLESMKRIKKIEDARDAAAKAKQIQDEINAEAANKRAEQEAKRAEAALTYYKGEIKSLREKYITITQGEAAAAKFRDREAGVRDPQQKNTLANLRQQIKLEEARAEANEKAAEAAQAYSDDLDDRLDALRLEKIELKYGEAAALRAKDIADGLSVQDANRLAALRAQNEAIEQQNTIAQEALDLSEKQKEEARDKLLAARESAKQAEEELKYQILGLRLGEEAEQQARDRAAGFTLDERERLANLRKIRDDLEETEKNAKTASRGLTKTREVGSFGGGGAFNKSLFGSRFGVVGEDKTTKAIRDEGRKSRLQAAIEARKQQKIWDEAGFTRKAQFVELQRLNNRIGIN